MSGWVQDRGLLFTCQVALGRLIRLLKSQCPHVSHGPLAASGPLHCHSLCLDVLARAPCDSLPHFIQVPAQKPPPQRASVDPVTNPR